MMSPNAPNRGSLPALVMRTGLIAPGVKPSQARADLDLEHVMDVTDPSEYLPGALSPRPTMEPLLPAAPSPTTTAVAATTTAIPPTPLPNAPLAEMPLHPSEQHHWHRQHRGSNPLVNEIRRLHPTANIAGAEPELGEYAGRPLAKFAIALQPPPEGARYAASAIRRTAQILRQTGLATLPPELVGGPVAALLRGGAIELHFQNGVVIRATP